MTEDRYRHGDLRRALIASAVALLTETQDWSFSLREVARRAGVSHNAPYNHFDSKQDLLAAVAAVGYDTLTAQIREAAARAGSPPAALKAVGVTYVRFGIGNPAHYRLMFGGALPSADLLPDQRGSRSAVGDSAAAAQGVLRDIIRWGAETGSFALSPARVEASDVAVLSAWSLVHGLTMLLLDGHLGTETAPQPSFLAAEQIADQVGQLLLDGIGTKHAR